MQSSTSLASVKVSGQQANQVTFESAMKIFNQPFMDLIDQARAAHKAGFGISGKSNAVQISTLVSIKTGGCPEDCSYCSQSTRYKTGTKIEPMMSVEAVVEKAKRAKAAGADRFCMGAMGRGPRDQDLIKVCEMVREVRKLGLETCVTLGMLKPHQSEMLKEAGLDFYNHNVDTSPEFYDKVITTRTMQDRLDTIELVRQTGIKVCCGGILGMGETNDDRVKMLVLLANLETPPESVPINKLVRIPGTPLAGQPDIDPFDFVRTIALARILMPRSYVRLSAGRQQMSDELQALCFMAGANSIFYGEKLLTVSNPLPERDNQLFERLGLEKLESSGVSNSTACVR